MKEGTRKTTEAGSTETKNSRDREKPKYSGPSAEDMLQGPCRIHYAYLDGKRVSIHQMKDCKNIPKVTRCSGVKPRSTLRRYKQKSRISSAT
jgi:hypothetical protein